VQLEDRYVNPRVVPDFGPGFPPAAASEYLVRNVPYDQVEHVVDAAAHAEQAGAEMAPTQPCLLLTRRT
jgi:GntR family histidine utilization transcriptional repressor